MGRRGGPALEGGVALERGPVVYCVEGVDHGGRALNLVLPDNAVLEPEFRADLLGGVTVLRGSGRTVSGPGASQPTVLTAIPYAVWNNRGRSEMNVWLPRQVWQ